jgi:hypothetical protein
MAKLEVASAVYLLIQPEPGPIPFAVSLWIFLSTESAEPSMSAPAASWHDFAQRIEQAGLLDNRSLGSVDAQIGRGEPVLRPIACTPDSLRKIGLTEVPPCHAKRLPASFLRFSKNKSVKLGLLSTAEL